MVGRFVVVVVAVVLLLLLFLWESGYETTGCVLVAALSQGTGVGHRHVDTAHFPRVRKQRLFFRNGKISNRTAW